MTEHLDRFHIVIQIDGEIRHWAFEDASDVLKLVAETKPTGGYLLFYGTQLQSVLDVCVQRALPRKDLVTLADVVNWEEQRSTADADGYSAGQEGEEDDASTFQEGAYDER